MSSPSPPAPNPSQHYGLNQCHVSLRWLPEEGSASPLCFSLLSFPFSADWGAVCGGRPLFPRPACRAKPSIPLISAQPLLRLRGWGRGGGAHVGEIMTYVADRLGYIKLLMGHLDLAIDLGKGT